MNSLSKTAFIVAVCGALGWTSTAAAQRPTGSAASRSTNSAVDRIELFDSLESSFTGTKPSDLATSKMSIEEMRQARAVYRANQRIQRLERNLWMGYEPLRPQWNSVPMMNSRYTPRRSYVPVYLYSR